MCLRTGEDIMANDRYAANRKNALKSTGPKTPCGKAVASRNAVKHGIFTAVPILSGIESRDDDGSQKPEKPATAREKGRNASEVVKTLKALSKLSDDKWLDSESAVTALWALSEELPDDRESVSVPGIPDEDADFADFDKWTAGLLRKATEVYAAAAGITVDNLLSRCISSAYRTIVAADEEERDLVEQARRWKLALERENRRRMLLEPEVLDRVARYESGLERSFFRTLHEIQRLQASRTGAAAPPPAAVDVDMTVHPNRFS